ncbi:MAG: polymer-forming cytoskeletal protein [Oligoflexales bacterium]
MFNNNQKKPVSKASNEMDNVGVTILTKGCEFNGKLFCRGSTRIGGKVEGEIVSEGLLIIEEHASIRANIKADEIVVQGRVNGKVEARTRVELCPSATFEGDVMTPILVVKEGAHFDGRSQMIPAEVQQTGTTQQIRREKHNKQSEPKISALDNSPEVAAAMKLPEVIANA